MEVTLAQKVLAEDSTLSLIRHIERDAIVITKRGKTTGIHETVVLKLENQSGSTSTNPELSRYLGIAHYARLYHAISKEPQFYRVNEFLNSEINDKGDISKIEDLVAQLSQD